MEYTKKQYLINGSKKFESNTYKVCHNKEKREGYISLRVFLCLSHLHYILKQFSTLYIIYYRYLTSTRILIQPYVPLRVQETLTSQLSLHQNHILQLQHIHPYIIHFFLKYLLLFVNHIYILYKVSKTNKEVLNTYFIFWEDDYIA